MSAGKKVEPISQATIRNLNDKLYDKRKLGAVEVEQQVKDLNKQQDHEKLMEILLYLQDSFIRSTSVSSRKGGLIALAAAALGLGTDIGKYIQQLVPPVLSCFMDQDNKVRYYACEALYNIAKSARGAILHYFNEVFDELCKLAADPDVNVRNAADVLDGLVKDIVTEGNTFDVDQFIPMLSKRIYVTNTECRKFLVSWLIVLDSVPDIIEMVQYLPSFLDGLFIMLSDTSEEIRNVVGAALSEFLAQIRKKSSKVNFGAVVQIVLAHCATTDPYNFITSQTAVTWVSELLSIGNNLLLPYGSQILNNILPCMAHSSRLVDELARGANKRLLDLVMQTTESVDVKSFLDIVQSQLLHQRVPTRLAALRWVLTLYLRSSTELLQYMADFFPALLKTLSDPAEEVVRLDLQVLAKLASNDVYFGRLMGSMVHLFRTDRKLLEHRGNLIIRQLSLSIKPEQIFRALSQILEPEEDAEFSSTMIQSLNLILLTATELHELRSQLKNLDSESSQELFTVLYRSWCHNPTAAFSLCLLSQVYPHAADLVTKFGDLEVTVSFLIEIDKLVQLLESPIFIFLRLQLLEPQRYPYLFKCLYGLLMLLPQSTAFETLKNRLTSVTSLGVLQLIPQNPDVQPKQPGSIDFPSLLKHFVDVQNKHAIFVRQSRMQTEQTGIMSPSSSHSDSVDRVDMHASSGAILQSSSSLQILPESRQPLSARQPASVASPTMPIRRVGHSEPPSPQGM